MRSGVRNGAMETDQYGTKPSEIGEGNPLKGAARVADQLEPARKRS